MFQKSYTEQELKDLLENTAPRRGWDFSRMHTQRQPVPWNYLDIVALYLQSEYHVLDVGTGGSENFIKLSKLFKFGIGVDIDPEMVEVAKENGRKVSNVSFYQDTEHLGNTKEQFDVIINRHAQLSLEAIFNHLRPKGYFITQQVGEKNMLNIKNVINKNSDTPVITPEEIEIINLSMMLDLRFTAQ